VLPRFLYIIENSIDSNKKQGNVKDPVQGSELRQKAVLVAIYAIWVIAESGIPLYSLNLDDSLSRVDPELFAAFISAMQSFISEVIDERMNFVTFGTITLHIREGKPHTYIIASSSDAVFDSVALLNDVAGFFQSFVPDGAFDLPEEIKNKVESSIKTIVNRHEFDTSLTKTYRSLDARSILKRTIPIAGIVDGMIKKAILSKFGAPGLDLVIYTDSKYTLNLLAKQVEISLEQAIEIANWCVSEGLLVKVGEASRSEAGEVLKTEVFGPELPEEELDPIKEYVRGTISLEKAVSTIVTTAIDNNGWSRISAWWRRKSIKKQLSTIKYRNMTKLLQLEDIPTVETFIRQFKSEAET